jgi:ABC-type branched-subunit amino acid transport system substrate-binding protein
MTGRETADRIVRARTRRDALATVGATGALVLAGCIGGGGDGNGNGNESEDANGGTTGNGDDDTVQIGISIPRSGGRNNEGEQMLQGYELAVHHINEGAAGATVEPFAEIGEDGGLLGRQLETVVADTESTGSGARESAGTLADDGVTMFTGGASADEGLAHQEVASDRELLYMGGFTPSAAVSGEGCTRYAFNEMYNAKMAADSLAPIVAQEMRDAETVNFAQLYPDNEFGDEFSAEIRDRFESIGDSWFHQRRESTREGERSYAADIETVVSGDPNLIVLNYYGLDAASALRELDEVVGPDVAVVVPLINRELARTAGSALEGVIGTVHWPPEPREEEGWALRVSHPFRDTFLANWDDVEGELDVPSPVSHLAYVQTCQYAAAVARAGTFDVDAVIGELEDHTYGYGMGDQTLRACDHQAMRTVPVVIGLPASEHQPGNFYQLSDLQASLGIGGSEPYPCDQSPAADCSLE